MKRFCLIFLTAAALAACEGRDPVADGAGNTSGLPAPNQTAPDASASTPPDTAVTAPSEPEAPDTGAAKIPAALHGRWGMGPADCTSTRGDAKGLLVVTADQLRFYESVAVPTDDAKAGADWIRGEFDFTGEGQNWTKFQALALNGRDLVRTESNPNASYTYAKCS